MKAACCAQKQCFLSPVICYEKSTPSDQQQTDSYSYPSTLPSNLVIRLLIRHDSIDHAPYTHPDVTDIVGSCKSITLMKYLDAKPLFT